MMNAVEDRSKMSWSIRLMYIFAGSAILLLNLLPFIPAITWAILEPYLLGSMVSLSCVMAGWFLYQGIRGRW